MRPNLQRRSLILGAGASALTVGEVHSMPAPTAAESPPPPPGVPPPPPPPAPGPLSLIEARTGGRLGVLGWDIESGARAQNRMKEHFPMCSMFKALLVPAVLEMVDRGALRLDQNIKFGRTDLLDYAPVARAALSKGSLSVEELCAAAVELSDNTAANLLLSLVDGPQGLTQTLRRWGDPDTRLDRNEPTLNECRPGDPRDTTMPLVLGYTLHRLIMGSVLQPKSRDLWLTWMRNCQTGKDKLRAGLPPGVIVGDKTGNNARDTMNDIAIVDLPGRKPILILAFLTEAKIDTKAQPAILAEVGHTVMAALAAQAAARGKPFHG